MAIGNLEVMPAKIKHCKKLCTEMDCSTIFNWFWLTPLSRAWSKVDIMSYFHKFSCTQCNKTQLHALSQNERICYKQWSWMYRDEIFTCFAVTGFMIISEIMLLAETQVPFQITEQSEWYKTELKLSTVHQWNTVRQFHLLSGSYVECWNIRVCRLSQWYSWYLEGL